MVNKFWILAKERFHPAVYLPTILVFSLANGFYGLKEQGQNFHLSLFAVVFLIMLSFFFRLRLFDEIKDYEVDLKINPTRPLARGVLTIREVKVALAVLIAFELITAALLGKAVLIAELIAVFYSLLMYKEFFIGDFLRPHLTTYAVTHTFVSCLTGYVCATAILPEPTLLSGKALFFFLMNWFFFNLFEFARKTFATVEERPQVASYSTIFGIRGAILLSLSQVALGLVVISEQAMTSFIPCAILAAIYIASCIPFFVKPTKRFAQIFRGSTGLYLLLHYLVFLIFLRG